MAVPVHPSLPALSPRDVERDDPGVPLCALSAEVASAEAPLTSEPPLPDAEPLTSEPPLADATPLTSEPSAAGADPTRF
ncbi:hypothetical protein ACWD5Q_26910 [Streptomyces sp. NPDC002513]